MEAMDQLLIKDVKSINEIMIDMENFVIWEKISLLVVMLDKKLLFNYLWMMV